MAKIIEYDLRVGGRTRATFGNKTDARRAASDFIGKGKITIKKVTRNISSEKKRRLKKKGFFSVFK